MQCLGQKGFFAKGIDQYAAAYKMRSYIWVGTDNPSPERS